MFNYIRNSEISLRIGVNPFNWKWVPAIAYDGPTPFYPKRRTYALAFLFLQVFLDVDDGTSDLSTLTKLFNMENIDVHEVGSEVSEVGERSLELE